MKLLSYGATLLLFAVAYTASAQLPGTSITDDINASGTISVNHPEALEQRVRYCDSPAESADDAPTTKRTSGYRVQVFSDNNPDTAHSKAYERADEMKTFSKYPIYVKYEDSYWRVKVGNFRTKEEADAAAEELKKAFPKYAGEFRVKQDRINVK